MPPWMEPTRKPQDFSSLYQVVEGVPELREDKQPLVGIVEEPLLPHDFVEAG